MDRLTARTLCRSCGREAASLSRWHPVIMRGEVKGHTCPACPKHGEPIQRMENGAGVRFRARLTLGSNYEGRQRWESKTFDKLEDARQFVKARGAEIEKSRKIASVVVDHSRTTVGEVVDQWLAHVLADPDIRANTAENYGYRVKPIQRRLGSKPVQALRKADVVDFVRWLRAEGGRDGRPLGAHAARGSTLTLKQVLKFARDEGMIHVSPADGVKAPKVASHNDGDLERWTQAEWEKFVGFVLDDVHAAAWLLIAAGLRREEALGLDWSAVDVRSGLVKVRQTRVKVSRNVDPRGWVLGAVKTEGSRSNASLRDLDVSLFIEDFTQAIKSLHMASGRPSTGLVFVDEFGEPLSPDWFSKRFAALCRDAGVPDINVHSSRHTLAYLMDEWGIPPRRAAKWLGHDQSTYLGIYLFDRADDLQRTAIELGAMRRSARVSA